MFDFFYVMAYIEWVVYYQVDGVFRIDKEYCVYSSSRVFFIVQYVVQLRYFYVQVSDDRKLEIDVCFFFYVVYLGQVGVNVIDVKIKQFGVVFVKELLVNCKSVYFSCINWCEVGRVREQNYLVVFVVFGKFQRFGSCRGGKVRCLIVDVWYLIDCGVIFYVFLFVLLFDNINL